MCYANKEKKKKTNNERNRTTKSKKNQNAWRKGKLLIPGNLEADAIKQVEIKVKVNKDSSVEREISLNQYLRPELHLGNKHLNSDLYKILRAIVKIDMKRTQSNGSEDKKDDYVAQGFASE